jgi:four helix bundle protein
VPPCRSRRIATNLAEGNGRFTKPDRRNFFTIARSSVRESPFALETRVGEIAAAAPSRD